MNQYVLWFLIGTMLFTSAPVAAQSTGNHTPANAAGILNALPPDLYKKMERLAQLIDQSIKSGKLTDAQVQQELMSGRLDQTIRGLGPEAGQLMDEIQSDMQSGNGPGENALMPLLGGLGQ
ncbi:exported protein of unknown function [Nitrospira sp. KM1]|uniref:hypothetical protein n=1 Tax=Nitrospira sp. KM1 TaxID=1936990 RepID=UPI0013A77D5A|nr:hypothetical protein [Nitrospira sp. KM1]BCA54264.1 exported protein of unknown function [Nitrospira sp. KM1]